MRLTNTLRLPEPLVRAVARDDYDGGGAWRTVTQLIAPARLTALLAQHADEVVEDVANRIWALLGQSVHEILRRADLDALTEQRLTCTVEDRAVSGQFDRLVFTPAGLLQDYKVTSLWSVKDGGKREWEEQLNLYAHLVRQEGHLVDALEVVAILRDWRRNEARRYPDYPPFQVSVLEVPLWPPSRAEAFLHERVRVHMAAERTLPECTDEERWRRPATWAVKKPGRLSALGVYATEAEARAAVGSNRALTVEHRPGEAIRCESYCPVAAFCTQWQQEQKGAHDAIAQ